MQADLKERLEERAKFYATDPLGYVNPADMVSFKDGAEWFHDKVYTPERLTLNMMLRVHEERLMNLYDALNKWESRPSLSKNPITKTEIRALLTLGKL